jgi:hypothetical protein
MIVPNVGWKDDPLTLKKLPVESDVPELLSHIGSLNNVNQLGKAIGDLALIAFYYLLRVGEYTVKNSRNQAKQTVQFCLGDVTFFKYDCTGKLRQLSRLATVCLNTLSRTSRTLHRLQCSSIAILTIHHDKIKEKHIKRNYNIITILLDKITLKSVVGRRQKV